MKKNDYKRHFSMCDGRRLGVDGRMCFCIENGCWLRAGGYSVFFKDKTARDVRKEIRNRGILKNHKLNYLALVDFLESSLKNSELVCENRGESDLFSVGDEVITSNGRKGKIVGFCQCEWCKRRGYSEPQVLYEDSECIEWITISDKKFGFKDFYKIGDTVFGHADVERIDKKISRLNKSIVKWENRRKNLLEAMNNGKE